MYIVNYIVYNVNNVRNTNMQSHTIYTMQNYVIQMYLIRYTMYSAFYNVYTVQFT